MKRYRPPDPRDRDHNTYPSQGRGPIGPLSLFREDAMTKKSDIASPDKNPKQLFVYGLDEAGKPKGARFSISEMETVGPVIAAQKLQFFEGRHRRTGQSRHEVSGGPDIRPRKILHSEHQA